MPITLITIRSQFPPPQQLAPAQSGEQFLWSMVLTLKIASFLAKRRQPFSSLQILTPFVGCSCFLHLMSESCCTCSPECFGARGLLRSSCAFQSSSFASLVFCTALFLDGNLELVIPFPQPMPVPVYLFGVEALQALLSKAPVIMS